MPALLGSRLPDASLSISAGLEHGKFQKSPSPTIKKACDGGYKRGCFNLGVGYYNGEGVTKDLARAAELFKKACDGGEAAGCFNLGIRYDNGEGVTKVRIPVHLSARSAWT